MSPRKLRKSAGTPGSKGGATKKEVVVAGAVKKVTPAASRLSGKTGSSPQTSPVNTANLRRSRRSLCGTSPAIVQRKGSRNTPVASKVTPAKSTPSKKSPSKDTPKKNTPSKGTPSKSTPSKTTALKTTPVRGTPSRNSALKGTPSKMTPQKRQGQLDLSIVKTEVITPTRGVLLRSSPLKFSPKMNFIKGLKSPSPAIRSAKKQDQSTWSTSPQRLTRKRLLSSPEKSPCSPKSRKSLTGMSRIKMEPEPDSAAGESFSGGEDDTAAALPIECDVKCEEGKALALKSSKSPVVPELSGRFLRRKWFSLKTRGGFTCLRSAILSPEEIAQEVIQHTMVYPPKVEDANFFTTKLMVRLSSRLPPSRARPSCEELVELINSKQQRKNCDVPKPANGEGTAIRVKLESRSFTDTISQVTSNPTKEQSTAPTVRAQSPLKIPKTNIFSAPIQVPKQLTKKKEREIALNQLKSMRYWRNGECKY